jgi:hypothetical protein
MLALQKCQGILVLEGVDWYDRQLKKRRPVPAGKEGTGQLRSPAASAGDLSSCCSILPLSGLARRRLTQSNVKIGNGPCMSRSTGRSVLSLCWDFKQRSDHRTKEVPGQKGLFTRTLGVRVLRKKDTPFSRSGSCQETPETKLQARCLTSYPLLR